VDKSRPGRARLERRNRLPGAGQRPPGAWMLTSDREPERAGLEVAERLLRTILVLLVIAALLFYTLRRRR